MKCQSCDNEMAVDHTETTETITKYIYVCTNPKCSEYLKAITATGEESTAQITPTI